MLCSNRLEEEILSTASQIRRPCRTQAVRVSIGMPVYNGERYLRKAIESILRQTFRDFELIISDNASTDRTASICKTYARRDERVRYYRSAQNLGAAKNFNRTFELSRGAYFKWVAADEGIEETFLEECVTILERDPTIAVACTRYIEHDEFSQSVRRGNYDHSFLSPRPNERLSKLLSRTVAPVLPIWGLMRSSVLGETRLIRPFIGADHCLVADLILKGKCAQHSDHLTWLRTHQSAYHTMCHSTEGVQGIAEARWFDPDSTGTMFFPHWRRLWEYLVLVMQARADVSSKSRMLCFLICVFGIRWSKLMIKDLAFASGMGFAYAKARETWTWIRGSVRGRSFNGMDR